MPGNSKPFRAFDRYFMLTHNDADGAQRFVAHKFSPRTAVLNFVGQVRPRWRLCWTSRCSSRNRLPDRMVWSTAAISVGDSTNVARKFNCRHLHAEAKAEWGAYSRATRGFDSYPAVAKPAGNEHAGYIFELASLRLDPLPRRSISNRSQSWLAAARSRWVICRRPKSMYLPDRDLDPFLGETTARQTCASSQIGLRRLRPSNLQTSASILRHET